MPRQAGGDPELTFKDEECLFRLLQSNHFDAAGVTIDAIDLLGTSVDREMFRDSPDACLPAQPSKLVAVASVVFGALPENIQNPNSPDGLRDVVVVYLPENGNMAHSEIRTCLSECTENNKPGSKAFKAHIKCVLAAVFEVVVEPIVPHPIDDEFA